MQEVWNEALMELQGRVPDKIFNHPQNHSAYVRIADWRVPGLEGPQPLGFCLTDIAVPPRLQGQGYGRTLMRMALDWADENSIDLCITIAPAGAMDYDDLEAWYRRCGFEYDDRGIMRRKARACH